MWNFRGVKKKKNTHCSILLCVCYTFKNDAVADTSCSTLISIPIGTATKHNQPVYVFSASLALSDISLY